MRFVSVFLLGALFLFPACMKLGINFHNKTAKKASVLPKFTVKDSLMGANGKYRRCYDVSHYDIHLNIDPAKKSINGFITSSFRLLEKSDSLQLDLDPQFVIDSIISNNKKIKYARRFTALMLSLADHKEQQSITVHYHGKPKVAPKPPWKGGFVWKKDKNKKDFIGVACEGDGANTWLAIKSYLGDESDSADMHFTVPAHLTAVSNGQFISAKEQDAVKTFHWKTTYPINPYNITLYVGDYKNIQSPYTCLDGTKMMRSYYVLPQNFDKAEKHFEQSDSILRIYEGLFGPYPFVRDGYKLVESPYAGMEHQSAIAYGNGYKNERNETYDYIILHETAHEWWGNSVSVADFADVWIHEGIATYAESLYLEKKKDHNAYLYNISFNYLTIMNRKPVVGPREVYYWNYKDGDNYFKGAAMLHSLRNHLNNDVLFFDILKSFYNQHKMGFATTEDFIKLVAEKSGKDQGAFFRQYLYSRKVPYLKWNFDYDFGIGRDQLIYKWEDVNEDFTTPITVTQGDHEFVIYPSKKVQFYTLPEKASVPVSMNYKNTYLRSGYKELEKVKSK